MPLLMRLAYFWVALPVQWMVRFLAPIVASPHEAWYEEPQER